MKKGQAGMQGVAALVYFAIILVIGLQVFSSFETQATNLASTTQAASALGNVTNNTYGGFQTVSVGPTVIAAVVILGIVGMLLMRRG